ncbi:MAG: hypothetical protein OZ923_03880 [Comamonadaceae bacterium]|nr:hypothetical protein [Burkholderiales bacterium]MEB2347729.1 hypothetical protein [Comamonadaceae bacterium]
MNRVFNPPLVGAVVVLVILGAVALGWVWLRAGKPAQLPPVALMATCLPVALPLLAALLLGTGDRAQWAITVWGLALLASVMPGGYLLNGGAGSVGTQWRFLLAYGALWVLLLVAYLLWIAPWAMRVPPAPGALPVSQQRLMQRVLSLAQAGLALVVEPSMSEPGQITVTRHVRDGKRSIAVRLSFVADRHCVLARELSRVRGDQPMNASEAQMRQGIQPRDGTHPDADLIYDASLTLTPPSEATRRALALRLAGDRVEVGQSGAAADPANLPHLLAELVRQSGWTWQGVFFNWQKGCGPAATD